MRSESLDINDSVDIDDSIVDWKLITHTPNGSPAFNSNDEIRIGCWQMNVITHPSESYLLIEGKLTANGAAPANDNVKFINNAMAFLFEEIKYYVAGVQVDCTRNLGITSTLKNHCSLDYLNSLSLSHTGWNPDYKQTQLFGENGNFQYCLPLKMVIGFAEDYQKIITGVSQELVLLRSSDHKNALLAAKTGAPPVLPKVELNISKISWRIPYINVADIKRLEILRFIEQDLPITIPFRSWELHEYPSLPQSDKHIWTVRSSSLLERPRFIIVAFQSGRKNNYEKDNSIFDACDVESVKLFLNSTQYPYESVRSDFSGNLFSENYGMYRRFRSSFYSEEEQKILPGHMTAKYFHSSAPIHVIDCSHQTEPIKSGALDIRLEFNMKKSITTNDVSAFCLILHDNILQYTPLTGIIKRVN